MFFMAFACMFPLLAGSSCKKPPPPTPDAEAPAAAPDTGVAALTTLDEDAGDDADAADAGKKWTGPGMNPNEARVRQCCAVLRARVKQLGAIPEAAHFQVLVQQCDAIAAAVHANPNAPELNAIRSMPGCQ
jgi:hypothetical protein